MADGHWLRQHEEEGSYLGYYGNLYCCDGGNRLQGFTRNLFVEQLFEFSRDRLGRFGTAHVGNIKYAGVAL